MNAIQFKRVRIIVTTNSNDPFHSVCFPNTLVHLVTGKHLRKRAAEKTSQENYPSPAWYIVPSNPSTAFE